MTPQRRKTALIIFTLVCIVGAGGFIYVGYALFRDRLSIFWLFSVYIVLLAAIVIFFGFRLIGVDPSQGD